MLNTPLEAHKALFTLGQTIQTNNGLSVVAIDDASGKVIGALCCMDETMPGMGCCQMCSLVWKVMRTFSKYPTLNTIQTCYDQIMVTGNEEINKVKKAKKIKATHGVAGCLCSVATHKDF